MDENAEETIREHQLLSGNRGNLEAHCDEIARLMLPGHSNLFQSQSQLKTKGDKRNQDILDSTAVVALGRFASILDSILTPRNQTWHHIMVDDEYLAKDRQVKLYFEQVNRVLFKQRYAPSANFSSQNQQDYLSIGAYGTSGLFTDEFFGRKGFRYKNIFLGELFPQENHQGIIDKVLRYFPMTARQAFGKWGEKCPEGIKNALKNNAEQEFFFIHRVKPRTEYDPSKVDYTGMPWSSCYVSIEGRMTMEEGGYTSFPYACARYNQMPGEVYGRSPAMDILPAAKTLRQEKAIVLKQGHRAVDPIYLMENDGIMDVFSAKPGMGVPGGVNADGRPLVHTLPFGRVDIGKELMDDERQIINDAFLITLFQILVETPQMTATEVMERTREKGILIAPTAGRLQSEKLAPQIERELDIASKQGLLPPMPQLLREAKGQYRIEYDSPLSRAQRAEEASGYMRTVESVLQVVNVTQDKAPLDYFNWDVIVPDLSQINAVPTSWMNSVESVQAIRQNRQTQMQDQQAIQAAPGMAAMVNSVAKTRQTAAK